MGVACQDYPELGVFYRNCPFLLTVANFTLASQLTSECSGSNLIVRPSVVRHTKRCLTGPAVSLTASARKRSAALDGEQRVCFNDLLVATLNPKLNSNQPRCSHVYLNETEFSLFLFFSLLISFLPFFLLFFFFRGAERVPVSQSFRNNLTERLSVMGEREKKKRKKKLRHH